ncbi:MAG: SRPBCC domain-containing protein [Myxococcales bacterium]|nr:SRPBCC domain-containing protein [Myxococcales bacterium]
MDHTVRAEIDIDGPPEAVWQTLVDFERYPEWNPFTPRVESTLELGAPIDMRVVMRGGRTIRQREYVCEHVPGSRVAWEMRLGRLLHARRVQRVSALDGQRTRYVSEDRVRGLLAPLVLALFERSIQDGFDQAAAALKRRVESASAGGAAG